MIIDNVKQHKLYLFSYHIRIIRWLKSLYGTNILDFALQKSLNSATQIKISVRKIKICNS